MRTESFTKKGRVYLTPKTYLSRVKLGCTLLFTFIFASVAAIFAFTGITFVSISAAGVLFGGAVLVCRYMLKKSTEASFKGDNLILKNLRNRSVVTPVGSIRNVKSGDVLGVKYTRVSYNVDGSSNSFVIVGRRANGRHPEEIIRTELANARERKKMANHKPGPVLTQSA